MRIRSILYGIVALYQLLRFTMSGSFMHLQNESGYLVFGGGAVVLVALCLVQVSDPDRRIGAVLVLGKSVEMVVSLVTVATLYRHPFLDRTIVISMYSLAFGDTLMLLILILLQRRRKMERPVALPDYEEIDLEEE